MHWNTQTLMGKDCESEMSKIFNNYGAIVKRLSRLGLVPFTWNKSIFQIATKPSSGVNAVARVFSVGTLMVFLNFQLLRVLLNGEVPGLAKLHLTARTLNVTTILFSYQIIFQNPHHLPNVVNNLIRVYFKWNGKFSDNFQCYKVSKLFLFLFQGRFSATRRQCVPRVWQEFCECCRQFVSSLSFPFLFPS